MSLESVETASAAEAIPARPRLLDEESFQARAQNQWLKLRNWYAYGIFWWLTSQVVVSIFSLFALGFGWMHLSPWIADAFFVTAFGQVVGLAALVIKNLFPTQSS